MKKIFFLLCIVTLLVSCGVPLSQINGNQPTVTVYLDVEPVDAKVFLDDIYIGRAKRFDEDHGGLPVTIGVHQIRLEAEGYLSERVDVTSTEERTTITVRMLTRPEEE